ncbi:MAG: GNAT family N-acetyltransferase [Bdellovibrionales bacterium]|nr:GNAT family N-acetyltransferase [Bdellovibrionales bacterium]
MSVVEYQCFLGPGIEPWIEELAKLRIQVFREFPYCYEGDMDNETRYLSTYLKTPNIHLILAFQDKKLIGASTSLPLLDEEEAIQKPFLEKGFKLDRVYYFGESVILSEARGQGTGHEFFRQREEQAKKMIPDLEWTSFCGVNRPETHPLKPQNYRNLHEFWQRMGYEPRPDMQARLEWKDLGDDHKSEKTLTFWLKKWS